MMMKSCEYLLNDDSKVSVQQGKRNCTENAIAGKHEGGCKFCRKSFATFAEVKGSQNPESLFADKYELTKDNNENNNNEVADLPHRV
jgi:hypothetical protein